MKKASPVEVKVGQLWRDMDPRMSSRALGRVVEILPNGALLQIGAQVRPVPILAKRMRGRVEDGLRSGWSLAKEAP